MVGHRIQDNSERIPSVLMSELLDYCQQGFNIAPEQLLTQHSLQPYSPNQFMVSGELFSYAHEWLPAAARQGDTRNPFYEQSGIPEQDDITEVELAELLRFYTNPCRYFCNRRLKVYFDSRDQAIAETEPFDLAGLDSYLVQDELLNSMIADEPPETMKARLQGCGRLPHAAFGELWLEEQRSGLEKLADRVRPLLSQPQDDLEINLNIKQLHITGWLKNRYNQGHGTLPPGQH